MNISRYGLSFLGSGLIALTVISSAAQAQQAPPGYGYNYPQQGYGQAPVYPQQGYQDPRYQYQQPQAQGYPQQGYPATSPDGYPIPGSNYQGNPGYQGNPEYEAGFPTPLDFFPNFGRKVGQAFRRMFYGDGRDQGYYPQQPEPSPYDGGGIHNNNLDSAPPPYSSHYGAQVPPSQPPPQQRYQTPPQSQAPYQQPPSRYQTPPAQQQVPQPQPQSRYQTPPPATNRYVPPAPPSGRSGSVLTPQTQTKKPSSPTKSTTSSPPAPKKSTPATTGKGSKSNVQDSPPYSKPPSSPDSTTQYQSPSAGTQPKASAPSKQDNVASSKGSGSSGSGGSFLKGKRTAKNGRVISPYPPYQELDVTGLSSGSLAMDPTTQKVFEVP